MYDSDPSSSVTTIHLGPHARVIVLRGRIRDRAEDARTVDTTVVSRPVTVQTGPDAVRTTLYRGRVVWGGMFTGHVLEKAALYFP